jgi:hypothetical protein
MDKHNGKGPGAQFQLIKNGFLLRQNFRQPGFLPFGYDAVLGGPCYLKISSYLPFPCEFYFNGHNPRSHVTTSATSWINAVCHTK